MSLHGPRVETWRMFIAIELPGELRAQLSEHVNQLRKALPDVRASWNREPNFHLTLKFLGDVPLARVEDLTQATGRAALAIQPFNLTVNGGGVFPPHRRPKVLWVGIEDTDGQLSELHANLENECNRAGFAREERPFHPHLTIARLRDSHGAGRAAELHRKMPLRNHTIEVAAIVLFRSELLSEGSRHTAVSRHSLSS